MFVVAVSVGARARVCVCVRVVFFFLQDAMDEYLDQAAKEIKVLRAKYVLTKESVFVMMAYVLTV